MAGGSSSRSHGGDQLTHWLNVTWADLVERLALFFYTDESFETVDYLNVMLLGWALFGLFVYVVGTLLANRFGRQRPGVAASAKRDDGKEPVDETVAAGTAEEQQSHVASVARWAKAGAKGSDGVPFAVSASGSDPDAVLWTNRVLSWVLTRTDHEFLSKPWIQALNEKLAKSPPKVGDEDSTLRSTGQVVVAPPGTFRGSRVPGALSRRWKPPAANTSDDITAAGAPVLAACTVSSGVPAGGASLSLPLEPLLYLAGQALSCTVRRAGSVPRAPLITAAAAAVAAAARRRRLRLGSGPGTFHARRFGRRKSGSA
ncbi:hypothetical protein HPB49_010820 [Dermacentor silvarum]|uniref:Uncharacterized protein n=1 Tax=Dermacentor silvarum TaxID=543639 RepID=A0ACB8CKL6_DERSI|nr:hypothetical protein HPB49_010820 [Dermacentor silvarum]